MKNPQMRMSRFGVAVVLGLSSCPAAAMADRTIGFEYSGLELAYTAESGRLTISAGPGESDAIFSLFSGPNSIIAGSADIFADQGGVFSVLFDLALSKQDGGGYALAGTVIATDISTDSNAIEAEFHSTGLKLDAFGNLLFGGDLRPLAGASSILVNRESDAQAGDWSYRAGGPEDGPGSVIEVSDAASFARGLVSQLHFGAGSIDLESFFATDRYLRDGNGKGLILNPVPGAFLLGTIGLCMIARLRRRFS